MLLKLSMQPRVRTFTGLAVKLCNNTSLLFCSVLFLSLELVYANGPCHVWTEVLMGWAGHENIGPLP